MSPSFGYRTALFLLLGGMCLELSAQELRSPESIVHDDSRERYLISNTVDGTIRTVDDEGRITDFGTDAEGSHGLLILNDMLYACFRNEIKCYDLETEKLMDTYTVEGSKFLNGICTDDKGFLYVTDFSERVVFRLSMDQTTGRPMNAEEWLELGAIPNGIAYDDLRDELVLVTWGSAGMLYCVDRQTTQIKHEVESGYGNLESIVIDESGDAYVTAWSPSAILKFEQGVRTSPTVWKDDEVFRPTGMAFDGAGELIYLSSDASTVHGISKGNSFKRPGLDAFPNPVSVNSMITYTVAEEGYVNITVYDSRGNLVQTLLTEERKAGQYQFMYERQDRASGLYFINIQSGGSSEAIAVTLVD